MHGCMMLLPAWVHVLVQPCGQAAANPFHPSTAPHAPLLLRSAMRWGVFAFFAGLVTLATLFVW